MTRPPDFSFEREGRSLSTWLPDLVADDAAARLAAGEALQAMLYGVPSIHTDLSELDSSWSRRVDGQGERFAEAVRATVRSRGFPRSDFVRRLVSRRIALKEDWLERCERGRQPAETRRRCGERLRQRIEDSRDDAEREKASDRYSRWVFAGAVRDSKRTEGIYAGAECMAPSGLMSGIVFRSLHEVLLDDRRGLRRMLQTRGKFHEAAAALERIGPAAVDFAGFLLDRLDAQTSSPYFDGARALGSIGRDDPAVIDGLLKRLKSGGEAVRMGAAAALGHAGPSLAGRLEAALDALMTATYSPVMVHAATTALASVGRDREDVLIRILDLAAPRPPRWRHVQGWPDQRYDEVMYERGVAIEALARFPRFADQVVPALIEAFDTFEEFDSDWDRGEHARCCWAMRELGPGALPAVPRLVRYLAEWLDRPKDERSWPEDVFRLLATLGPPAAEALPALERILATLPGGGDTSSSALDPDEPLDHAILALRGALPEQFTLASVPI